MRCPMDTYSFIYEIAKKAKFEQIPLYIEVGPPIQNEEKIEKEEEHSIIIELW